MPRVRTAVEDMPLADRLIGGLAYPLRGGALMACIALGLCHYAMLLPSLVGVIAASIVWLATWRYAVDVMLQTADGFDDAPEVAREDRAGNPNALFLVNVFAILACIAVAFWAPGFLWLTLIVAALLLPAIDMSLAFDGDITVAMHPATWLSVVKRFGSAYLIPVVANAVLAVALGIAQVGIGQLPRLLALPVFGFVCTYLIVLDFHWMGVLVWHYRERFGMQPAAPALVESMGWDDDQRLLDACWQIAATNPEAAAIELRDRIRDHLAPAPIHRMFRDLLRQLGRHDLLLAHGQTWIAQLCASGDARRALGVVQECRDIEPYFLPDDPANVAMLAENAQRSGMHRLAEHLARGFAQRWPQHEAAERVAALVADTPRLT
ncbi:MAG TPA: hypothetical protein VHD89_12835 [Rhodanobacteraceae bacterium]|jgi:hypothetical protein|nr:hypothetical protein [Rhodanobacteraceae bacterium]